MWECKEGPPLIVQLLGSQLIVDLVHLASQLHLAALGHNRRVGDLEVEGVDHHQAEQEHGEEVEEPHDLALELVVDVQEEEGQRPGRGKAAIEWER